MGWPAEQLELPDDLKACITSGKCVAFIGSGASAAAGIYPTWVELVNSVCEACGSGLRVNEASPVDEYLTAAEEAKTRNIKAYYRTIGEKFGQYPNRTSLIYRALLGLPFQSYLTTNFDPLLAYEASTSGNGQRQEQEVYSFPNLDRRRVGDRSIHYLHGYVEIGNTPAANTIVLAKSDFANAYEDNGPVMNMIVPTFVNEPICFIGCGLKEPPLEQAFRICERHQDERFRLQGSENTTPPKKYILVPRPEVRTDSGIDMELSKQKLDLDHKRFSQLGIDVIWYSAPGNDHSILQIALDNLAQFQIPKPKYGWGNGG